MKEWIFKGDSREILRYLGVSKNSGEDMLPLIEDIKEETRNILRFRWVYNIYSIVQESKGVILKDVEILLKGQHIKSHLKNSSKCVVLAATLGSEIDRRINYYQKCDMLKALIVNACATAFIEEGCNYVESLIKEEFCSDYEELTWRYSPGYGDLSLDVQGELLKLLQGNKDIGLYLSESNMLIPKKSVTAIVGIIPKGKSSNKKSCENCLNKNNCNYRKTGESCGN